MNKQTRDSIARLLTNLQQDTIKMQKSLVALPEEPTCDDLDKFFVDMDDVEAQFEDLRDVVDGI